MSIGICTSHPSKLDRQQRSVAGIRPREVVVLVQVAHIGVHLMHGQLKVAVVLVVVHVGQNIVQSGDGVSVVAVMLDFGVPVGVDLQ